MVARLLAKLQDTEFCVTNIHTAVKRLDLYQLAKEAFEVEEKEEKLVHETVKHLTEANVQISYLSEEFSVKSDESRKQKEEITHLLAQVVIGNSRRSADSRAQKLTPIYSPTSLGLQSSDEVEAILQGE